MIGNDVVDLALAATQSNWQRAGFLNKLFTIGEQQLIRNSENPGCAVWDLWSRKEAVYKIVNRQTGIRKFMPLRLRCTDLSEQSVVIYNGRRYFTQTQKTAGKIETNAVTQLFLFDNIVQVTSDKIQKINELPFYKSHKLFPASVSQHGQYYAAVVLFDSESRLQFQKQ